MTTKAETLREVLPKPETMLTYASMLEKPQYQVDPKTGVKYRLATGEVVEAACAALRYCAALAPSIEGQAGGGESEEWSLACTLAGAELNYRNSYEQRGPDHIETGRRWDKMRHAGDAIRAHEPVSVTPHQRATGELIGWRYARKSWNGKLWRRVDVKPDFETPEDWILEPLYAIPSVSGADRAAVIEEFLSVTRKAISTAPKVEGYHDIIREPSRGELFSAVETAVRATISGK